MQETIVDSLLRLEAALSRRTPSVWSRFQAGLSREEIDGCVSRFEWTLPPEVYDLYGWRNGLSGQQTGKQSLVEKLLRLKDRWHGTLSGPENELIVSYAERRVTVKFMPLEYAIAGYRHLKLGRCPLELLPIFMIIDGKTKHYGMVDVRDQPGIVYVANGTKAPPWGITQEFLSEQPKFTLAAVCSLLADYATAADVTTSSRQVDEEAVDACTVDAQRLAMLQQRYRA